MVKPINYHVHKGPNGHVVHHAHNHGGVEHSHDSLQPADRWKWEQ